MRAANGDQQGYAAGKRGSRLEMTDLLLFMSAVLMEVGSIDCWSSVVMIGFRS